MLKYGKITKISEFSIDQVPWKYQTEGSKKCYRKAKNLFRDSNEYLDEHGRNNTTQRSKFLENSWHESN